MSTTKPVRAARTIVTQRAADDSAYARFRGEFLAVFAGLLVAMRAARDLVYGLVVRGARNRRTV